TRSDRDWSSDVCSSDLIVLLVILGLPIALVLAWTFEITPEGLKRTEHLAPNYGPSKSRAWIYIVIVGALVSIGLFFLGRYTAGKDRKSTRLNSSHDQIS